MWQAAPPLDAQWRLRELRRCTVSADLRRRRHQDALVFLGLQEDEMPQEADATAHICGGLLPAAPQITSCRSPVQIQTAFAALHAEVRGDFETELCSPGEAIRLDSGGHPILVDIQRRHDLQLHFALFFAFATMLGVTAMAAAIGLAPKRRAGQDADPEQAESGSSSEGSDYDNPAVAS